MAYEKGDNSTWPVGQSLMKYDVATNPNAPKYCYWVVIGVGPGED